MKQKVLTEKQKEILQRLELVINEAIENNIGFIFDDEDCSVTAYNAENITSTDYVENCEDCENFAEIDWFKCHVMSSRLDRFDSNFSKLGVVFEK